MNLDELKGRARVAGYTNICLDEKRAYPVSLAEWRGIAPGEAWATHQGLQAVLTRQVAYDLEGNKVRAKRAGDKEFFWYVLS
jgi:hypothetical protein